MEDHLRGLGWCPALARSCCTVLCDLAETPCWRGGEMLLFSPMTPDPRCHCPGPHPPPSPEYLTWSGDRGNGQACGAEVPRAGGSHVSSRGEASVYLAAQETGRGLLGGENLPFKGAPPEGGPTGSKGVVASGALTSLWAAPPSLPSAGLLSGLCSCSFLLTTPCRVSAWSGHLLWGHQDPPGLRGLRAGPTGPPRRVAPGPSFLVHVGLAAHFHPVQVPRAAKACSSHD
ncbi:hypothetical protein H1C71_018903 [Ictidomys tridecemlineatus]|nr:hypothetical protein H1C71_018903 [Ictidomys tridecemlineatus]